MTTRKDSEASEVEMRGWKFEQTQFLNGVSRHSRGQTVEVAFDDIGLEMQAESGSAYNRSSETVYLPLEVLIALMTHAGYRVDKPAPHSGGPCETCGDHNHYGPCFPTEKP